MRATRFLCYKSVGHVTEYNPTEHDLLGLQIRAEDRTPKGTQNPGLEAPKEFIARYDDRVASMDVWFRILHQNDLSYDVP